MKHRRFNVIDRAVQKARQEIETGNVTNSTSKVRESLPYIGFVYPSDSITEENVKQINSERYDQAYRTYEIMKKDGYSPTLEGYIKKEDDSFVSTQDAHRLCKDK